MSWAIPPRGLTGFARGSFATRVSLFRDLEWVSSSSQLWVPACPNKRIPQLRFGHRRVAKSLADMRANGTKNPVAVLFLPMLHKRHGYDLALFGEVGRAGGSTLYRLRSWTLPEVSVRTFRAAERLMRMWGI